MRILIWDKSCSLSEVGGPIGYMWNIKEYLRLNPKDEIVFYSDLVKKQPSIINKTKLRSFINYLEKYSLFKLLLFLYRTFFKNLSLSEEDKSLVSQFDFVHFHVFQAFYPVRNDVALLGKSIITTHTPEPFIDEVFSTYNYKWLLGVVPFLRIYLIKKEIEIYNHASYVMFPAKEAIEVYTEHSKIFSSVLKKNSFKIFYVPTCVVDKGNIFNYNHDNSSLKVCYIGRHNTIKGYDQLKQIAEEVFLKNDKIEFIIGGKEEPLKGLNHPNWKEKGWINTSDTLDSVDVFILPNKETYFDLIYLEVLRQGVPIISTNTGGNKFFKRFNDAALYFYDYGDIKTAVKEILQLAKIKKDVGLMGLRKKNRKIYEENFTMEIYVNKYLEEVKRLK